MKLPAANGLCEICNRNQELKIHQLANFIPTNDRHFDDEIAEYKYVKSSIYLHKSTPSNHLHSVLGKSWKILTSFV